MAYGLTQSHLDAPVCFPALPTVKGVSFDAPQGRIVVEPNHHISQRARIGRVNAAGQFDIVETSRQPIKPQPWNQFLNGSQGYACDWSDPNKGEKYKV